MFAPGFNSPTRFEADIYDCEVWGQIPSDIEGTFYRVACDFQYRPPENEWPTGFNGDGHVTAFRFANDSSGLFLQWKQTSIVGNGRFLLKPDLRLRAHVFIS